MKMNHTAQILGLLTLMLSFGCSGLLNPPAVKTEEPLDYSKVKAIIDGNECHMFPGYNCEPVNRTFVGQDNGEYIHLCFTSLNMAQNYMSSNSKDNDTIYTISIWVYLRKEDFASNRRYGFNTYSDSTQIWHERFMEGDNMSPVIYGKLWSCAIHDERKKVDGEWTEPMWDYTITSGWVEFGEIESEPHLLYGGNRMALKCKEASFEFEATAEDGKVLHVTDGYCCL